MTRKRGFAVPFVISVTALSSACGGSTEADGGPIGGSGGTQTGGTSATGGSGGVGGTGGHVDGGAGGTGPGGYGGGTTTGGTGGTTQDAGNCPPTLPNWWEQCTLPAGTLCEYQVPCQSGNVAIEVSCGSWGWEVVAKPCTKPYDSCPGTDLYCGPGGWTMPQGTNPPAPCPDTPPQQGDACYPGGMGGVWEHCGYPCDPVTKAGWTIASCPYPEAGATMSSWTYDGSCPP